MATWNYRVIKTEEDGEALFAIHEVHYDDSGDARSYAENASPVMWAEGDDPFKVIAMMGNALSLPVLTPADFGVTE